MEEPHSQQYTDPPSVRPIAWVNWTIVASTVAVFLLQLGWLHRYGEDFIGDTLHRRYT